MSTVKAANLQNTGSGAPTFKNSSGTEIGQLAKAWINYNGSTNAIRDSFNVSSITDEGGGTHQINFTNAFADANYAAVGLCSFGIYARTTTPATTTTFKVGTFDTRNAANQDENFVYLAFFAA